jgi:cell division protein FtsL
VSSTPVSVRGRRAATKSPRSHSTNTAPHLRVVRRKSRTLVVRGRSRRLAPIAIVAAIVMMAVILGVLLEQVVLAQSAFKLSRIREQVVAAEERHQDLLLEAAKLESSDRIERYAREVLGMVEPDPARVHYLVANVHRDDELRVARAEKSDAPVIGQAAGDPLDEELQP